MPGAPAFDDKQTAEFKVAFGVFDVDGNGTIEASDLKQVYENLGKTANDKELKAMIAEVKGPLNFAAMLQLYWDKLSGTDEEPVLAAAFKLFDTANSGSIKVDALKEILTQEGRPAERLSEAEVKFEFILNLFYFKFIYFKQFAQVLEGAPIKDGAVDYNAFVRLIKRGKADEE